MKNTPAKQAKIERIARAKRYRHLAKTMSFTDIGRMENISRQRVKQLIESLK